MKKIDWKKKWDETCLLFQYMGDDHVSEFSAQCAYYTILSFIPFLILLITLIQYTNIGQQALIEAISKIIPASMNEMIIGIVKEVYSKSLGTISISIIFTLWSAGKGFYALTKGLQGVYKINKEEKTNIFYLRAKVIVETIVFLLLIVIGLVLLVFGKSWVSIIQIKFGALKNFNVMYEIITDLVLVFFTFLIFLCLYKFVPRRKVSFKSQILGAVFGAIALNIVSFVFSKYLDIFKGFSLTYGSLTTLMLIMMWTYSCFYTIFLGAEFNKLYGKIKKSKSPKGL